MGEIDTLEAQHFFLEANHNVNFYFILVFIAYAEDRCHPIYI